MFWLTSACCVAVSRRSGRLTSYNKDAAYEEVLRKDEERLLLMRAKRGAHRTPRKADRRRFDLPAADDGHVASGAGDGDAQSEVGDITVSGGRYYGDGRYYSQLKSRSTCSKGEMSIKLL